MHAHSIHEVRTDAFEYAWDNSVEPVLSVESGAEVLLHVRDASDEQIHAGSTLDAVAGLDFSHVNPVSGPVEVRGAKPGDVLAVDILEFRPRDWGWTAIFPGFGLLAEEFPEPWLRISRVDAERGVVAFGEGIALPYEPFPGTIGVALPQPGRHSVLPPSDFGGNLDIRHLRAGSTLYLPVGVDGALFSVGDTHAAMGDGEVCGTAVETEMDITVRLSVRRDFAVEQPQYHLPAAPPEPAAMSAHHVCTGVAPDLMEAARKSVRSMIAHLGRRYGLDRQEAYALVSVACDLRIHEVVDAPNWVVGAFLPEAILSERI
jgi:acetamidase/formamidase